MAVPAATSAPRIAIICVGNEYQLDDGFGPAVARYLDDRYRFPLGVTVLDRAVMGYGIVSDLKACDVAVVVDALDGTGAAPGTTFSFDPADMRVSTGKTSLHEVRFADVLADALGVLPSALDIPHIKSREVLNQLLLALEDEYGLTVTITENNERSICNGK